MKIVMKKVGENKYQTEKVYEKGEKPIKYYGNYIEAGYNNIDEAIKMLQDARKKLTELYADENSERVVKFELIVKENTIAWKADVEEKAIQ